MKIKTFILAKRNYFSQALFVRIYVTNLKLVDFFFQIVSAEKQKCEKKQNCEGFFPSLQKTTIFSVLQSEINDCLAHIWYIK